MTKKSFTENFLDIQKQLFGYAFKTLHNKEEVEDILQEVFIKAYKAKDKFDEQRKFASWIYRITHNEVVNLIRRKSLRQLVDIEDQIQLTDERPNAYEEWIVNETVAEITNRLQKLKPIYQKIIALRYFQDKSYLEISESVGLPVSTIGVYINRAKKQIL